MKVTLVIGLPASGKTTYAKSLGGFLVDDPKSMDEFPESCDYLVVADPNFCIDSCLSKAIKLLDIKYNTPEIEKIYFENDPIQCYKNSIKRIDKPVTESIKLLGRYYNPDPTCKIIPCYGK